MATFVFLRPSLLVLVLVLVLVEFWGVGSSTLHVGSEGFGVYMEMIHRDHSMLSPYYNSSLTVSSRLLEAARRAEARHAARSSSSATFQSVVVPNVYDYLATIHIGTPPQKVLAILDTGSDLTWTKCRPCTGCYVQLDPVYDPATSSTYAPQPCGSKACSLLPDGGCSHSGGCHYNYYYADGSNTHG